MIRRTARQIHPATVMQLVRHVRGLGNVTTLYVDDLGTWWVLDHEDADNGAESIAYPVDASELREVR